MATIPRLARVDLDSLTADAPRAVRRALMRNIRAVWRAADADQRAAGAAWYAVARAEARELARAVKGPLTAGAGILAALSPACDWALNVRWAREMATTGDCTGQTGDNKKKARAIVAGGDPLDILGGLKVRAFHQNILDGTDVWTVTVDRHAFDLAVGFVAGKDGVNALGRVGVYDLVADCYRAVAAELGEPAHVVQAVVWLTWRAAK